MEYGDQIYIWGERGLWIARLDNWVGDSEPNEMGNIEVFAGFKENSIIFDISNSRCFCVIQ